MRLRRSRLVGVVTAIACVVLAATVLRLAEAKPPYQVLRGQVGVARAVAGGEITVDDVRVGTKLTRDGSVVATTPGMFVVISVTAADTGTKEFRRTDTRLLAQGDRSYSSYGFTSVSAEPGYQEQLDYVYEVDPKRITDLTTEIWALEIISGYQQRLQVHLGITAANAEQWRTAAAGESIEANTGGSTRAIG